MALMANLILLLLNELLNLNLLLYLRYRNGTKSGYKYWHNHR